MATDQFIAPRTLGDPDWNAVRPIYKKLSDEFNVLTEAYSVTLDDRKKLMLDHLILSIDAVDQSIDSLPTKAERDDLTNAMLQFLGNSATSWSHELAPKVLADKMITLKLIVQELQVGKRFLEAVAKIFKYTEEKRHTLEANTLIELVMEEGRATAELPLSIMDIDSAKPFGQFFSNLCMLMGVADLVVDARSDYKANYIALRPNLSLYFKLNFILVKKGLKLVWKFPSKIRFIRYCIKFTWLLFTSEE